MLGKVISWSHFQGARFVSQQAEPQLDGPHHVGYECGDSIISTFRGGTIADAITIAARGSQCNKIGCDILVCALFKDVGREWKMFFAICELKGNHLVLAGSGVGSARSICPIRILLSIA